MNLLDHDVLLMHFRNHYFFFIAAVFAGAFLFTYYIIPKVLWVSKEKNLTAPINNRSSHKVETPSFGGVAFYITLILFLALLQTMRINFIGSHLIAAISILFMVGLKDDLVISSARAKLLGQVAASCFIIFAPNMQLENLNGFMGIHEIPLLVGYLINMILFIALINAYNLIDGIDGLAAMIGIFILLVFAAVFYNLKEPFFVLVSVSTAGILFSFLRFNFSRGQNKIFMGDSGSLVIGFLIAFMSIKLLNMPTINPLNGVHYNPANKLLFLACVLFIPVFDTLRVFILRLLDKRSPFDADRNHIHHVLLEKGLTHFQVCLSLLGFNSLIVLTYFGFNGMLTHFWLAVLIITIYLIAFLTFSELKAEKTVVSGFKRRLF